MSKFWEKLMLTFGDERLRSRILATLGILILTRILAIIPVPGIDTSQLQSLFTGSDFLNLLNIFSGGGLSKLSIVMLGVGPFITASIIMQLLTVMVPQLKSMYQEEGEAGRRKFSQYSRLLTIPLALIQGYAFLELLVRRGVLPPMSLSQMSTNLIIIVAGSILLMWLGELITEFGVGNGVSLIIFAGIVSRLPQTLGQLLQTFVPSQLPVYIGSLIVSLIVIYAVVLITEAERPIPVTYAKQVRGNRVYGGMSTYLPLRINQAGVIPIIFALSILLFPQMILQFLVTSNIVWLASFSRTAIDLLNNQWFYGGAYFLLVFVFTYFYTAVTFDPHQISENLQKGGAFIPGVRPGPSTAEYISRILTRLTLVGAVFLGIIAVLPLAIGGFTGNQSLAVGGTALLIVVSVILDLMKKVDAQISVREY